MSGLTVDAASPKALPVVGRPKTPVLDRVKRQMEEEGFNECQLGPNLAIPTAEFNGKSVHVKIVSS